MHVITVILHKILARLKQEEFLTDKCYRRKYQKGAPKLDEGLYIYVLIKQKRGSIIAYMKFKPAEIQLILQISCKYSTVED